MQIIEKYIEALENRDFYELGELLQRMACILITALPGQENTSIIYMEKKRSPCFSEISFFSVNILFWNLPC